MLFMTEATCFEIFELIGWALPVCYGQMPLKYQIIWRRRTSWHRYYAAIIKAVINIKICAICHDATRGIIIHATNAMPCRQPLINVERLAYSIDEHVEGARWYWRVARHQSCWPRRRRVIRLLSLRLSKCSKIVTLPSGDRLAANEDDCATLFVTVTCLYRSLPQ